MGKGDAYDDLIFQLGDLARERLVNKPSCPRTMDRVLRAEQTLAARQAELAELEAQMNEEDAAFQELVAQIDAQRPEKEALVKKWKKAVDAIGERVKTVRKKVT